ncbi:MAG: hypothetical protein MZV64_32530, partial [Ignavibacteriales bacterium]|nr:hypothetical protein [Ignavibacteriales bacterium]
VWPFSYVLLRLNRRLQTDRQHLQRIDYSEGSEVIKSLLKEVENEFFTDDTRPVYSKGGIASDTTVEFSYQWRINERAFPRRVMFSSAQIIIISIILRASFLK